MYMIVCWPGNTLKARDGPEWAGLVPTRLRVETQSLQVACWRWRWAAPEPSGLPDLSPAQHHRPGERGCAAALFRRVDTDPKPAECFSLRKEVVMRSKLLLVHCSRRKRRKREVQRISRSSGRIRARKTNWVMMDSLKCKMTENGDF